jgi:hypothetical protein
LRYLALCLTGCVGVAVLGARRPGVGAWDFVLLGLLAVLLLVAGGAVAGVMVANRGKAGTSTPPATTAAVAAQAPTTSVQPARPAPSTVPAAATADVRVANQGFLQLPPDASGESKVSYAVLVTNPRASQVATDVRLVIAFRDASGRLLETKDKDLDVLLPGQTGAVAGDSDITGAAGMRVQAFVGAWAPAPGTAGRLTVTGVHTTPTAGGGATTTATLHSTFTRDLNDAKAVAVYYDQAGHIVGGESSDLDVIPAGRAIGVVIEAKSAPPGIARTEVYTTLKDLAALGG